MEPIRDPSAWKAGDFRGPRDFTTPFPAALLTEIDAALAAGAGRDRAPWALEPATFPLASAGPLVAGVRATLERGAGFAVLTGFPVDRWGPEASLRAYCAVAAHLGSITEQTHRGDRVVEVTDRGKPYDHASRGYASSRALPFHTDGAGAVGLLCLGAAASGGASTLVSAVTVYNTLAEERPDLLPVLERGFHHHRRGEEGPGEPPVSAERIPVFSFRHGLLHCMYNRNPIEWAEREGVRLDRREREALDCLDAVAARPELQIRMAMNPGDVQLVNNFVILHSRTAYRDGPGRRRHLIRLWLELPDSRRDGPTLLDLYAPAAASG